MRRQAMLLVVAGGMATACGPSTRTPALAERCGQTEPIQLLALEPDETAEGTHPLRTARPGFVSVAQHGDRWIIGVRRYDRELPPELFLTGEDAPTLLSSRIVSVDACGGDARVVAEGAHEVRVPTGQEPWIGCSEDGTIVAFDPDVESSGQPYEDLGCTDAVVDDAFVTLSMPEQGQPALVRARLRADAPADVQVLVEASAGPRRLPEDPDRFLVVDASGALVEVDARTGAHEVLREGVEEFYATDDGRFIQWSPDARYGSGTWWLWDRDADEERPLGLEAWLETSSYGMHHGVVSAYSTTDDLEIHQVQLTWLPSQETLVLDEAWSVRARIGGASVLSTIDELAVLEPDTDELRRVSSDSPQRSWTEDDSLWALFHHPDPDVRSHSVVELAAPSFVPRLVATDAWFPLRLSDGRWLTVRDRGPGEGRHGTLVVLDEQDHAVEIDHDVIEVLHAYNGGEQASGAPPVVEGVVVYPVRDPDHERTGVWMAEIAPP